MFSRLKQFFAFVPFFLTIWIGAGIPMGHYGPGWKYPIDWSASDLPKDASSPELLLNYLENKVSQFDSMADRGLRYFKVEHSLAASEKIIKKRKEDMFKSLEEKNQDRLKSLEKTIAEVRDYRKQKFWDSINHVFSSENKVDFNNPEEIWEVMNNFFVYLRAASLEEMQDVMNKSSTELADNDLYKIQKRFIELSTEVISGSEAPRDRLISKVASRNIEDVGLMIRSIICTAAWNKDDQLKLLSNFDQLKRIFVRCGYGFVKDGTADSVFFIPLLNTVKHLYPMHFLYGECSGYSFSKTGYVMNDCDISYRKEDKIGDIRLPIYDEVIQKMKEADEKWYSAKAEPCGIEYFKGNLAGLRCFISQVLDMSYKANISFWGNIRSAEFIDAIFFDLPKVLLTLPFRFLLFPVSIVESILFYFPRVVILVFYP